MSLNNSNINQKEFQRYLNNEMSEKERNAFEKELQKNPFEAEALEGFEAASSVNINKDLKELKDKIQKKQKNRYRYWAAAASILLVISASVIWNQLDKQNPIVEIAETKDIENDKNIKEPATIEIHEFEIPDNDAEEMISPSQKKIKSALQKELESDKVAAAPKQVQKSTFMIVEDESEIEESVEVPIAESESKTLNVLADEKKEEIDEKGNQEDIKVQEAAILDTSIPKKIDYNSVSISGINLMPEGANSFIPQNRVITGKIISAEDSMPIVGATIVEKGTQNGIVSDMEGNFRLQLLNDSNTTVKASFVGMEPTEFQPNNNSNILISLEQNNQALEEVVTIGYGKPIKKSVQTGNAGSDNKSNFIKSQPLEGFEKYKKYLEKKAILPADFPQRKETVKVLLKISAFGKIESIRNKNAADSLLFQQAKEIIYKGGPWLPETKNGEFVDSEIELKIIFKR